MTKPFEPRKLVLFYPADDVVEEDIYLSAGLLRRMDSVSARNWRKYDKRWYRKFCKMNPTDPIELDFYF